MDAGCSGRLLHRIMPNNTIILHIQECNRLGTSIHMQMLLNRVGWHIKPLSILSSKPNMPHKQTPVLNRYHLHRKNLRPLPQARKRLKLQLRSLRKHNRMQHHLCQINLLHLLLHPR